jgi:ADP-ribose/FAD diphosphatase
MTSAKWARAEPTVEGMRFCSQCGGRVERRIPRGDDRQRSVCSACGEVHYQNPTMVVGCLVEDAGCLLLCRRAIDPGHGLWTLPAGFLELDEGLIQGARRETREEACVDVDVVAPHAFLDMPHIGQGYALFRASIEQGQCAQPGDETLETAFVPVDSLPWDDIAFPAVSVALQLYLDDLQRNEQRVHHAVLRWSGGEDRFDARSYELVDHLGVPLRKDD